ncbi:MarR family winged helix-turn-helix transcriptional regulator [Amorphus orientalis]|uniref:DNA-binding MarR family transcriptional regulator n=1 Tax=Amorphus orientalis TaxID=649198 RepID=A0AAE3VLR4_9HYPH|nr:MarR family winged helix-turn-helix transcriptional regulator [Amorphus orientalis]MDQ0314268.1 DNA-binding MarR family transcriptional regulator [Amorphus orientalis]
MPARQTREVVEEGPHPAVDDIRDLVTFRIAMLAATSDRVGQAWMKARFGLSILLWRVLGIVAALEPVRFGEVGHALNLDKGQLSRLVKSLIERGLIEATASEADQRVTILRLTAHGRTVHGEVLEIAKARNNAVLSALDGAEVETLLRLLDKLQPFLELRADAEERNTGAGERP